MAKNSWHILRDDATVTVARSLPVRFDVMAETTLPAGDPLRVAQQIRQDMWRGLQKLRGFSPVVRVTQRQETLHIAAGGACTGTFPKSRAKDQIESLLSDPKKRSRWVTFANKSRGAIRA